MKLFELLFSDDIKEAQDLQVKIEQNEVLQKEVKIKIEILRRAQREIISEGDFEYFKSEEKRLTSVLRKLAEDNKQLQDNFRISTNKVRVLQEATKNYENNI